MMTHATGIGQTPIPVPVACPSRNVTELGIAPFTIPALAEVELVAEKLRALAQRAQPRDLPDLRLYLVGIGSAP